MVKKKKKIQDSDKQSHTGSGCNFISLAKQFKRPACGPVCKWGLWALHSSTAPPDPNTVMKQSHSSSEKKKNLLKETPAADKPGHRSIKCSLGDSLRVGFLFYCTYTKHISN